MMHCTMEDLGALQAGEASVWARRHITMLSSADRPRKPLTSAPAEKNRSLADLTTATATSASATCPMAPSSSSRNPAS